MHARRPWILLFAVVALFAAACGDDGDDTTTADDPAAESDTGDSADTDGADTDDTDGDTADADTDADGDTGEGDGDTTPDAPAGGGGGTLVLGDETITLDSARCFLQEQDAFAGGGKILFVGQGFGTTAEGDELVLDVSRYDEDSQFTGDDVFVDIGDPFSDDLVSYNTSAELGTVQLDGSTMRADGLTLTTFDATGTSSDIPASFELNC